MLTLFGARLGKFCPNHHKSLVTFQWTLQISLYFMTLFLWTIYRSHWGHLSKKILKILKNQKIYFFNSDNPPLKKKNGKKKLKIIFFPKKSYFFNLNLNFTWSLLFFEVHSICFASNIQIFRFFSYKISINDQLYSSISSGKKIIKSD